MLALTVVDRESILRALDDPPTDAWPSCGECCCSSTSGAYARGSWSPGASRRRLERGGWGGAG